MSLSSTSGPSNLSLLLPSSAYLLAYTIPLLLLSILLTFAGTFLTIDRSRSFPSRSHGASYAALPIPGAFDAARKKVRINWVLEGGVGGLASGYVFGLHSSTFLAVLVPAVSSSKPLSPGSFLAVWLLSCIPTTILAGRYKYCAFLFSGISGGSLAALALSLIVHPPLLPRQVLTALLALVFPILILLFSSPRLSHLLHPTLRLATASTGAFSLILSIALLAHIPAWADIWERLWLQDGDTWGTSKEKGLSTSFCLFFCLGMCSDWALRRWLGECPDEKWDDYLADYAANFPNDASRAGTFQPFIHASFWHRFFQFNSSPSKKDIVFPSTSPTQHPRDSISKDLDLFPPSPNVAHAVKLYNARAGDLNDVYELHNPPTLIKKAKNSRRGGFQARNIAAGRNPARKPVKFGANLSSDSDSDSDSASPHSAQHNNARRPRMLQQALTPSSPTLVDEPRGVLLDVDMDTALADVQNVKAGALNEVPEYSDYEEDLTSIDVRKGVGAGIRRQPGGDAGWSPGFLKRHSAGDALSEGALLGAVPATPSLIKAIDRVSAARKDALGMGVAGARPAPQRNHASKHTTAQPDGLPRVSEGDHSDDDDEHTTANAHVQQRALRWEQFWRDVRTKAKS